MRIRGEGGGIASRKNVVTQSSEACVSAVVPLLGLSQQNWKEIKCFMASSPLHFSNSAVFHALNDSELWK